MAKRKIGDRVILTKSVSIKHFAVANMPITGTIADISEGRYRDRNYLIKFRDGRTAWYATEEIRKLK